MIQKVFRALAETALVWLTGFWAGYRPGPQLGVCMREATYWYFSYTLMFLVLSPSLPLSLKINRIFFLIRLSGMMQDGWESVESDPHSGRPATSRIPENVKCVGDAINKDQRPRWLSLPYSPDLVPWDVWLFPKLKSPLKGKRLWTVNEIQENTTRQLMVIPTKDFVECFEPWKRHWENCVRSQSAYLEGDWGVIVLCTMFLVSSSMNVSIFHIT